MKRGIDMSLTLDLILLEVIKKDKLLVYCRNKSRNYLIPVDRESAEFYRRKLAALERNQEILLKLDKESFNL